MEPLISVIVPVYKVEAYLARCLDSIVNQTYRNLEIILVDDGSPDNCGTICDDYARRDGRIRVIHQKNAGVAVARNAGLDVMTGEYLMFVDPDDWARLDAVQVLYDRIVADGSDMAVGKHTDVHEDGSRNDSSSSWMQNAVYSGDEMLASMGGRSCFSDVIWGKLYCRNLFHDLRFPDLRIGEDSWVHPYLIERCEKISSVNYEIYYYFRRSSSVTQVYDHASQLDRLTSALHMVQFLEKRGYMDAMKRWFAISVDIAYQISPKDIAVEMLNSCYSISEQRVCMKKQSLKCRIKWLALRHPMLGKAIKIIKTLKERIAQFKSGSPRQM